MSSSRGAELTRIVELIHDYHCHYYCSYYIIISLIGGCAH